METDSMENSGLILNLVQKAAVKAEGDQKLLTSCGYRNNYNNIPPSDERSAIKNSISCNLSERSNENYRKQETKEPTFKVSLTTTNENLEYDQENLSRKKIRMVPRQIYNSQETTDQKKIFVLQQLGRSQIHSEEYPAFLYIDGRIAESNGIKRKIPRPANAFMLFANEWRKKLAAENPRESNKDISVRLGILWKNMAKDVKEKYFALAREVDAEHKRKYPDYVYNPKEARIRKAMREQSRELSRRSILQNAIARAGEIGSPVSSTAFLDHQHRFGCVTATGLPINSTVESDRVTEPWFQSTARPKPIHSPRVADWYGNIGDPVERLQVMGTMHQRNIDKCKDIIRNQAATNASTGVATECTGAFSNSGYSANFSDVNRENELHRQENVMEYTEIPDGQKWHPYQNGGSSHQHSRTSHSSQVGGLLHSNVQPPSSHGHGPWGQFCHSVLPPMPPNIGLRGPRHTVLLRDHMSNSRHCGFSEEISRLTYPPSKVDVDNVRASYTPPEHQIPRLLESSVDSGMESTAAPRTRHEDEGSRWEPNNMNNGISMDNLTPTMQQESNVSREKERESRRFTERFESKKKAVSKQPLPGFHQAFGSTEIGRFSRSEFFVNMVGESGGTVEVDDSQNSNRLSKTYLSAPVIFPFLPRSCGILGGSATIHGIAENGEILSRIIPNECCWFSSQSRYGMSRISDNVMNCTAFMNCSHHARDKGWFCQSNTMVHPAGLQAALYQKENVESFENERTDRNYVVIGTANKGNGNIVDNTSNDAFNNETPKQLNLKVEIDGSLTYSNMQLNFPPAKNNEDV